MTAVTSEQWTLARRVESILRRENGCRDEELAERLDVAVTDLRPVLRALWGMRRADRCWSWTVAVPRRKVRAA